MFDGLLPTVEIMGGVVVLPAFFVATNGSDGNSGISESVPFLTVGKAQLAMRDDGTRSRTYIRAGTYNISSNIALTSADSDTSYLAYPGEVPILDGQGRVNGNIFKGDTSGVDGLTFEGLELQNLAYQKTPGQANRNGAIAFASSSNITIVRCNIHDVNAAIYHNGSGQTGWKILGNTITDTEFFSIFWEGTPADSFIAGNLITGAGLGAGTSNKVGAFGGGRGADNVVIEYNEIYDTNYIPVEMNDLSGNNWTNLRCRYNIVERYMLGRGFPFDDDGGGLYMFGRGISAGGGPATGAQIHDNWVQDCSPDLGTHLGIGIYLDDACSGVSVQNNVTLKIRNFSYEIHGGADNLIENNFALFIEGIPLGDNLTDNKDEQFMRYQTADPTWIDEADATGNTIKKNIMIPVNSSLVRISYDATGSPNQRNDWRSISGSMPDPAIQDNALGEDIAFDVDESSSAQFDSTSGGANNGGFKTYDPDNRILTLNKISRGDAADHPAYAEGFVDIAGVTDGTPFFWGLAGYDRSNYPEVQLP